MSEVEHYVIQMRKLLDIYHPDDLWLIQDVIRITYDVALCHPNEITNLIPKSSTWLSYSQYLIQMTYRHCRMSFGWLTILPYLIPMTQRHLNLKSLGWVSSWPYLIRMTYGRCIMSSWWLSLHWYLIRMNYGKSIMSSGWNTLPSYVIWMT